MQPPRLKSPLARAVVPVLAGIAFLAVLFLATWGAAALMSRNPDRISNTFANTIFEVGEVDHLADVIANDGPLLFPDLKSPNGTRSIVIDHSGTDATVGWQVYYGYPADRSADCLVTHTPRTRMFTDCTGRSLQVEQLALPPDVRPVVENRKKLYIDLRGITSGSSTTTSTIAPTSTTSE